jgi:hypothetical protein
VGLGLPTSSEIDHSLPAERELDILALVTRPQLPRRQFLANLAVGGVTLGLAACGTGNVNDEEAARRAYLGLDRAVDRALKLGFDGFNAATNANIPDQSEPGDESGTMIVGGQVDAGASDNKQMRLLVTLEADYSDGPVEDEIDIVYNGGPLNLDLSMQGLPNASLTGTFVGTVSMAGSLVGDVTLDLSITGETEEDPDGNIRRKAGTIRVVGTATSDYGIFDVDVSL